jgi:peroxiredoxin Q/BCP
MAAGFRVTSNRAPSNKDIVMAELATGQAAPQFELSSDGGGTIRLADLRGKFVVLYFYPKDDTSGCTAEAIDFSALKPEFDKAGAVVIGVSPDSREKHDKFKSKYGLAVQLVADEERKAINAYGVWAEKSMYGRKYMGVERSTFVIGPDGKIAKIWTNVRVSGHASEVLEAVRSL